MHAKEGMMLIELLIVVGLLVLLLSVTNTLIMYVDGYAVRAQMCSLAMACRYVQQRAVARGQPEYMLFDKDKGTYTCANCVEHLGAGVLFGLSQPVFGPPGSPVRLIQKPISFMGNKITFYPTGIMQSGTVYLTDRYKRCTYALSNAVSTVSHLRMYRLQGKKWHLL